MKFLITCIVILMTSTPALAGVLAAHKLSDDTSAVLNFGMELIQEGKTYRGATKVVKVKFPPTSESPYNFFCRREAIYIVDKTHEADVFGLKFPPVCQVNNRAGDEYSYGVYLPVCIVHEKNILSAFFSTSDESLAEARIAISDEHQNIRELEAKSLDVFTINIILNPLKQVEKIGPGIAEVKLFKMPVASEHRSGTKDTLPILAIHEIVEPYRHAAYLIDAPFPDFSIYLMAEPRFENQESSFILELSRIYLGKGKNSERSTSYTDKPILIQMNYDKIKAKIVESSKIREINRKLNHEPTPCFYRMEELSE